MGVSVRKGPKLSLGLRIEMDDALVSESSVSLETRAWDALEPRTEGGRCGNLRLLGF